jgi:hypothetical protein
MDSIPAISLSASISCKPATECRDGIVVRRDEEERAAASFVYKILAISDDRR